MLYLKILFAIILTAVTVFIVLIVADYGCEIITGGNLWYWIDDYKRKRAGD